MTERSYSQVKAVKKDKLTEKSTSLIPLKLVGESKHYPPANKEWSNSVYLYNKSNLKSLPVKDNITKKLIKSYFNLSMDKTMARSRRMRNLIRKSTAKKLFISSPEIKQTNDKVIVTVYTFDRERQFLLRKLYFNIIKWERLREKKIKRRKLFVAQPFNQYDLWRINKRLKVNKRIADKAKRALQLKSLRRSSKDQITSIKQVKPLTAHKDIALKTKVKKLKSIKILKRKRNRSRFGKKTIRFYIIRNLTEFKPKKLIYIYKPWLRETSRLKSFKRLSKKRYSMYIKKRKKTIAKKIPYFGLKHYNQMNFLYSRLDSKRKYVKAKKMLLYNYITYFLSLLNIKVHSFEETLTISKKKLKKLKKEDYEILEEISQDKSVIIKKKVPFYVRRFQQYTVPYLFDKEMRIHFYSNNANYSILLKDLSFNGLIIFLLAYVKKILIKSNLTLNRFGLKNHFSNYSNKYFLDIFYKSLFYVKDEKKLKRNLRRFNKDIFTINSILKLIINRFKFGKFLPGLKILISKIYSKKSELNIVNLKSPHLNTDIFTEAVAVKLKKRVGLLKVMRRSLQLVKLPYKFEAMPKQFTVNNLEILNLYRSLKLNGETPFKENIAYKQVNNTDSLQTILKTVYSRSLVNKPKLLDRIQKGLFTQTFVNRSENPLLNKITSVLNTIRYKWVTGIRLEAAGRLTRRYTASRSVFKFRYKGSLKNTDYSRKLDFMNNSMPNVMLRNLVKSNSQHSFLSSKKRIGAFGLNTWMSSY